MVRKGTSTSTDMQKKHTAALDSIAEARTELDSLVDAVFEPY
jgi:hypothetical protein